MASIERIRPEDWAAFRDVRLAALADTPSAFGSTLERELAFTEDVWQERAALSASGSVRGMWFAWDGDQVVGILGAFCEGDVVELISMWVAPAHRRAGVARGLVDAALDWARSVGAVRVDLWVTRGNDRALAFYESVGFTLTDDHQPLPSDPCKDELRMTRPCHTDI